MQKDMQEAQKFGGVLYPGEAPGIYENRELAEMHGSLKAGFAGGYSLNPSGGTLNQRKGAGTALLPAAPACPQRGGAFDPRLLQRLILFDLMPFFISCSLFLKII